MTLSKAPRIKIEFSDSAGAKYSFSVEGGVSKDKMVKLMEFVDSVSPSKQSQIQEPDFSNIDTNFSRVYGLLQSKFKFGSFTSVDVMEAYEDQYGVETSLSTVSTYLSRLAERSLVSRIRNGSGWTYKLAKIEQEVRTSQMLTP
ncbi:MAG: BlaI/MecI/CopY family transcriptional regulator [Nitrososphaerales archaeon]